MRPGRHRSRGFTLIELVIVTVITGILAAMLAPLALASLQAYGSTLGDVVVLDKLRYATERLAREIRSVQYASPTSGVTSCTNIPTPAVNKYCISSMTATGLAFRRFYKADKSDPTNVTIGTSTGASASCITPPCVTLAYDTVASNAAQVLTDELGTASNLAFTYYQQDGTTTLGTDNTNVSYVQISLTLRHNDNDYTQRTRVELRNQ
jgi:prepilin-type N-terminal cleavage/methylation domain-containing protein